MAISVYIYFCFFYSGFYPNGHRSCQIRIAVLIPLLGAIIPTKDNAAEKCQLFVSPKIKNMLMVWHKGDLCFVYEFIEERL